MKLRTLASTIMLLLAATTVARASDRLWRQLSAKGKQSYKARRYSEAEKYFLKAAKASRAVDDKRRRYVESLGHLASVYRAQGITTKVVRSYQIALDALGKEVGPDSPALVNVLTKLGSAIAETGDTAAASAHLERAQKILGGRSEGNASQHDELSLSRAGLLAKTGDVGQAVREYDRLLGIFTEAGAPRRIDILEGKLAALGSDPAGLETRMILATELAQIETPDPSRRRLLLDQVRTGARAAGKTKLAESAAAAITALAHETGDIGTLATLRLQVGIAALEAQESEAAMAACKEAERMLRETSALPAAIAEAVLCRAKGEHAAGDSDAALSTLAARIDLVGEDGPGLETKAKILLDLERLALAEGTLVHLLELQGGPTKASSVVALEQLVEVNLALEKTDVAERYLNAAVKLREADRSDIEAASGLRLLLAQLHLQQGKGDQALTELLAEQKTLEARPKPRIEPFDEVLMLQAVVHRRAGRLAKAEGLLLKAIEVRDRNRQLETLTTSGYFYRLGLVRQLGGELAKAGDAYRRVLAITFSIGKLRSPDRTRAHSGLGFVLTSQGKHVEARKHFTKALEILQAEKQTRGHTYATVLFNQAGMERAAGETQRARSLYTQVLPLFRSIRGSRHPESLAVEEDLADLAVIAKDWEEARRRLEPVIRGFEGRGGKNNPALVVPLFHYGMALLARPNRRNKGRAFVERAYRLARSKLGKKHATTKRIAATRKKFR